MSSKKRKPQPWWRKPRTLRRLATVVLSLFLLGGGAWYVLTTGESGPKQFLQEPAPAFSLPTTDNGSVVFSDHLGKHNVLLYFNEGMG
jgi:hypothetical protein